MLLLYNVHVEEKHRWDPSWLYLAADPLLSVEAPGGVVRPAPGVPEQSANYKQGGHSHLKEGTSAIFNISRFHRKSTARKEKGGGRHFFHQIEPN